MKILFVIGAAILLAACHSQSFPKPKGMAAYSRGQAYAQTNCTSCHAISRGASSSPNPNAPPFASIVNRDGLSSETLNSWLRDAHNYPNEMAFQVDDRVIDDVVDYMLKLKDPQYRPVG